MMRKLIVAEFITLDGVIQAPGDEKEDTEGGFEYGGWTRPYWHNNIGKHFFDAISQADALLLGRRTWEIHGGAFEPMPAGDPFGDVMNGFHKYVVSTTLKSASVWRNSALIRSNMVDAVQKLKQQPGKDILVDGSSVLIHTLAENNLVDEYKLHVYPIVLGKGKRLFSGSNRINLRLVDSQALPTGVIYQSYQSAE